MKINSTPNWSWTREGLSSVAYKNTASEWDFLIIGFRNHASKLQACTHQKILFTIDTDKIAKMEKLWKFDLL